MNRYLNNMAHNIWNFWVKKGKEDEFIKMNHVDWPRLFRRSPGYTGTEILKKGDEPEVYITIDRWKSKEAFDDFLNNNRTDYDILGERHRELYEKAEHIGFFNS